MTNPLVPHYYRVVIAPAGLVGATPADGFIDHVKIEEYGRDAGYPSTIANSRAKARANYRYRFLTESLAETQVISHILDIVNTGASPDAAPTSFEFTVVYDREEYVYTYNELYGVAGHATENDKELSGEDAIKRQVARVFAGNFKVNAEFPRDPASAVQGYGWLDEELEVGSNLSGSLAANIDAVESAITVTKIDNTY